MKVLDPGHQYELAHLDGESVSILTFVKRDGPGYPGNSGHHEGTTCQEVLRALIERCGYVNRQIPCWQTSLVICFLTIALYLFENRHQWRKNKVILRPWELDNPINPVNGHLIVMRGGVQKS